MKNIMKKIVYSREERASMIAADESCSLFFTDLLALFLALVIVVSLQGCGGGGGCGGSPVGPDVTAVPVATSPTGIGTGASTGTGTGTGMGTGTGGEAPAPAVFTKVLTPSQDPRYMCSDPAGNIYYSYGGGIYRAYPGGETLLAWYGGEFYDRYDYVPADGSDPMQMHGSFTGICWYQGYLTFAFDHHNMIYQLRSGKVYRIAGKGTFGFSGDGGQAKDAELYYPRGLVTDGTNLYISDWGNCRIRKIDGSGIITTYAGNGTYASTGDGGSALAASFVPAGLLWDNGKLIIKDNRGEFETWRSVEGGIIRNFALVPKNVGTVYATNANATPIGQIWANGADGIAPYKDGYALTFQSGVLYVSNGSGTVLVGTFQSPKECINVGGALYVGEEAPNGIWRRP